MWAGYRPGLHVPTWGVRDNLPVTVSEPAATLTARAPAPRTRRVTLDAACAQAVELARAAAESEAPVGAVGANLEVFADGERLVTHAFECRSPGYVGWRWAVTVARASRGKTVTVDEVVLIPGPDSLLAPAWVPWHERVQPGDLGVGDVLLTPVDDPRLAPGYTADADEEGALWPPQWELGLGRVRVLSAEGRDEAFERWYSSDHGPSAPIAKSAPARCGSCGFLLTLGGPLGQAFGVCAQEMSPGDGQVVSLDHGCGAHSEATTEPRDADSAHVVDEVGYDLLDLGHS